MRVYKTGDLCPCCGQPIKHTALEQLRLFNILVHVMGLDPGDETEEDGDEEDAPVAGQ